MKLLRYGSAIERLGNRYRLDGMLGSGGWLTSALRDWSSQEVLSLGREGQTPKTHVFPFSLVKRIGFTFRFLLYSVK